MNKYLFLFTIGPVQSFIAEARKTKDLYAGSKLLSDLIDMAIEEVKNKNNNAEIIFPAEDIKSKPNRFIAIVETDHPEDFGKSIETYVKTNFKNIANELFEKHFGGKNKPANFDNQINDFLEVFWIMKPYKDNYSKIYSTIERELGEIKNVRTFNQIEEQGRKCSLCGKRNVVIYKPTTQETKNGIQERNDGLLRKLYVKKESVIFYEKDDVNVQFGEGLCAVCFVKRFYKDVSFPSTAKIASLSWVLKIEEDEKYKVKLREYKSLFKDFDEQLFYEENLREDYLKKNNHFKYINDIKKAKDILKELYKDFGRPTSYYALLRLDGDNMGKWLSGEFLYDKGNLKDFHNKISKELGEYAKTVKEKIIQSEKGALIYAGGDDVMAFINLNCLFDVMQKLREKFPKFESLDFTLNNNKSSSASAGIVIAHYKTPLSEVLKWARNMEHEAKEKGGRDAFTIAVLKHSGEIHKTVYNWGGEGHWIVDLMKELVNELNDDNNGFSNNFIKTLQEEFRKMKDIPHDRILETELTRLLTRSSKSKDKEKKKEKIKGWAEKLKIIYLDSKAKENFFSFLNIADFLSREVKIVNRDKCT